MNSFVPNAQAQVEAEFLSRTTPFPPYRTPESVRYNLKWGKLTGRLSASVQFEYNDNVNLSETSPHEDFSIGPELGLGFLWPIDDVNVLQLDLGVGYRWYMNSPAISTVSIAPSQKSHVDYHLLLGDVRINVHDNFSTQVDPVSFGAVSGGAANLVNFRRFRNTAGLTADWRARRNLSFYGGYDYSIDRSLSSQFTNLDRDEHTMSAGMNWQASSRITAGVGAAYTITDYIQQVQNDGTSWSIGPRMSWKLSPFLTLDGSMAYSVSEFDNTGTIGDTDESRGLTYQFGLEHKINRNMSQYFRVSKNVDLGIGSNFTDVLSFQHGLNVMITSSISVGTTLAYETLTSSGALGETADRYLFSIGTGFQVTRYWSAGFAYALAWKDSNQAGRDYLQNRLTLDLTRRF
ncbi:MAG: hypothetical protein AB1705_18845 [Verrucomicrobiota bacterium]